MFRPKIGLALGGGGPRGLAHIGVIKVLEKNNIPIDYIAGTSAGAMVGGMYAHSKNIVSLEEHFLNKNWFQMLSYFADPSLKGGFIQGSKMDEFLQEYLQSATFDKLSIPFHATAVDLQTGKMKILHEGLVSTSIRASCAIPMLFKPVEVDNHLYVDGGLISSVPVETVKKMGADIVIAVQLNKYYEPNQDLNVLNILEIGELALNIVERRIAEDEVSAADFIIHPKVAQVRWDNLIQRDKRENGILLGENAANESINQIKIKVGENKVSHTIHQWIKRIKKLF
ncbi:MAG: patatin-like phospholipase family protein [Candidatus Roizmanbacteria bacterium]|nr:patatin-like phospholipase family protein [Candidatus Roizmanbacteria bacterium]